MTYDSLVAALVEFCKKASGLVLWLLKRYSFIAIVGAVAASLLLSGLPWINQQRVVSFTLLDGPAGGTGRDLATLLADEITKRSSSLGFQYAVQTIHTNGFEENRRRISEDATRRVFGFAHDGFGEADSVSALMPLEKSYLHVLARREFLERH